MSKKKKPTSKDSKNKKSCSNLPQEPNAIILPAKQKSVSRRPMTVDDFLAFERIDDPQINASGEFIAYTVTETDPLANKTTTNIWLKFEPNSNEMPQQLTDGGKYKHDTSPRWSPGGNQILFVSDRTGDDQLWIVDVVSGETRQLTAISTGASNPVWSPDGKLIAFVSAVFPEFSELPYAESNECNKQRLMKVNKSNVRVFNALPVQHWDKWEDGRKSHLFVMLAPKPGDTQQCEPKDVTPGEHHAFPTSSTFGSGVDYCFSPDSTHLVYTAPPRWCEAWDTVHEIRRVPVVGGRSMSLTIALGEGACCGPQFSPDGTKLAYRRQCIPGYEADLWRIVIEECDPSGALLENRKSYLYNDHGNPLVDMGLSASSFVWYGNESILFSADHKGKTPIYHLYPFNAPPSVKLLLGEEETQVGSNTSMTVAKNGVLSCIQSTLTSPPDVVRVTWEWNNTDGKSGNYKWICCPLQVSSKNAQLLAQLHLSPTDSVYVPESTDLLSAYDDAKSAETSPASVDLTQMHMLIMYPPGFDRNKKWPLAFLVHGGPQSSWDDSWNYRWNPLLWAAQGYVVAMPNPRGSTGFGQKYTDEISGHWGGKCFDDLMKGLVYLKTLSYIDTDRMAAAGPSFGGYMMAWFQGHTKEFKTLIYHDGVFNFESAYGTTDELWFDEWEHCGPPWQNRDSYRKFSPHLFAKNFSTPMLVIANDQDFRCAWSEGMQLFTTLQRMGIHSRFINFKDEGHWVLKPGNSKRWNEEIFSWLAQYCPPGAR